MVECVTNSETAVTVLTDGRESCVMRVSFSERATTEY